VKLVDFSGKKRKEYLEATFDELETNSNIKKCQRSREASATLRRVTSL
jgi:hypothetical protein